MFNQITAKDIMTQKLVTLKPSDDVYFGLRRLLENRISGAPVLDDAGNYLGVFTERSCMNVVMADQYHGMKSTLVGAFVYDDATIISPDMPLIEIAMIFLKQHSRRLPVVQDGVLLGQVSRRDVLRAVDNRRKQGKIKSRPSSPLPYYSALIDPLDSREEHPK